MQVSIMIMLGHSSHSCLFKLLIELNQDNEPCAGLIVLITIQPESFDKIKARIES